MPENSSIKRDSSLSPAAKGAIIFQQNCSSCHMEKGKLVGPPITEMVSIYHDNPEGLKAWIKAPGKKRPGYPQMPTLTQLTDEDRSLLAQYILTIKK